MEERNLFEELYATDVTGKMKAKNGMTYTPWAAAYAEIAKKVPGVTYEIVRFGEKQIPYVATDLGIMVFTNMTVDGVTREMCLPVMDASNRPLKTFDYTITKKKGDKTIDVTIPAATMFDINKSIMRCLAKNCAMFGVGLHLWLGEDVPEAVAELFELQQECFSLVKSKAALSDNAKAKVQELCKAADESADPREIEDVNVLKSLRKCLLAVRK